ncbi:Maturation and nuclear export of 40S ribosomal subunits interacting protein [Dispira parvispora]|uniref:Maturation and nuclear export of 40S ribosomal subunits interacting protein n=1 Tax=Dispira parvispora TaxID=1520584 RepID=A0A9W8E4K0_9FUNG|nr:Maturation and nuclear export of 40S ribosomal subunits interacting protein [Dispira parvispora]
MARERTKPTPQKGSTQSKTPVAQIREWEAQIHDSKKYLNNILLIHEQLQSQAAEVVYAGIHALSRVFAPYVERGAVRSHSETKQSAKENDEASAALEKVNRWLQEQYERFLKTLWARLRSTKEPTLQVALLRVALQLLQKENTVLCRENGYYTFPDELYQNLVTAIVNSVSYSDDFHNVWLTSYLRSYHDLHYYFLKVVGDVFSPDQEVGKSTRRGTSNSSSSLARVNVFRIVESLQPLPSSLDSTCQYWGEDPTHLPNKESAKRSRKKKRTGDRVQPTEPSLPTCPQACRQVFSRAWLAIMSYPLDMDTYKRVLLVMHKQIIPYMEFPHQLFDFLIAAYESGGVVSILALNSLFTLIQEHNLDYPDFYTKLYSLFDRQVMHVKYRARLFRLTTLFLSSSHLPVYVVAAFIKRMARLTLTAPPGAIVAIMPWIYNLLKEHAKCMPMLHRPGETTHGVLLRPQTDEQSGNQDSENSATDHLPIVDWLASDCFDMNTTDPKHSRAMESSLWELKTLQSHYSPVVSSLAKMFSERFNKPPYILEDFLDHTYTTLFKADVERVSKKPPALQAVLPKELFRSGDSFSELWDITGTEAE